MEKTNLFWHAEEKENTLLVLESSLKNGLSLREAGERLLIFGKNVLSGEKPITPTQIFFSQFKNVLVLILIFASVVSLFVGHAVEAVAIFVIVLFSAILGFFQEYRAEKALSAMKKLASPTSLVIREGQRMQISAEDLVLGDIVVISAGDKITADIRLLESVNLKVDESILTGESEASEKDANKILKPESDLGDRVNMVFAGCSAVYGRGLGVVVAVAKNTEIGKIANLLSKTKPSKTPLQKSLESLGKILGLVAIFVVALIVVLGLIRGLDLIEMLLFGISLAVAVVPEALPAVITISLALGVKRMLKINALARHLPVVEALGSVSVICTDKTGTLTKNQMTAQLLFTLKQTLEITGSGYQPVGEFLENQQVKELGAEAKRICLASCLCSDAKLVNIKKDWQVLGDPTEGALLTMALKSGLEEKVAEEKYPRIAEEPFSSETKRMITQHQMETEKVSFIKGSLEAVLDVCKYVYQNEKKIVLDEKIKNHIHKVAESRALLGERVIAFAESSEEKIEQISQGVFLGFVSMVDPPREEAKEAVKKCLSAGIKTVMITGDHPLTATTIARELGILTSGRVVSGHEIEKMSQQDLEKDIHLISVFARVTPQHKLRIVEAWQAQGAVVAMTGDGVNDAPALKKADVGVAMGKVGTEVAKESAGMTLLDDNFASIVLAVEEGREIFMNIKKYLMYLLSSHLGEVILIGSAVVLGLPLPLTAIQVLFINLAVDGPPALALAVDPPSGKVMQDTPRKKGASIFTRSMVWLMLSAALWSTLVNALMFYFGGHKERGFVVAGSMTFFSLVLIQFFKAYSMRTGLEPISLKTVFSNKWLNWAVVGQLPVLFLISYFGFFQKVFSTTALNSSEWLVVILASFSIVPFLEVVKYGLRRRKRIS
jgi:P-type Ca2+ transporter type 2C